MATKIKREDLEGEPSTEPEIIPESAPSAEGSPIPIVELEEVIRNESLTPEQQQNGQSFWFGHTGVIVFPDKTTYHIKAHTAFITDATLIANIKAFAESHPHAAIFPQ